MQTSSGILIKTYPHSMENYGGDQKAENMKQLGKLVSSALRAHTRAVQKYSNEYLTWNKLMKLVSSAFRAHTLAVQTYGNE